MNKKTTRIRTTTCACATLLLAGYALSGGDVRILDESGIREVNPATGSFYNSNGVAWRENTNTGSTTLSYLIVERK
ncbi:MAG TPA: hypothetical protein PKH39_18455 [Woeseiaceae bacterium]|nr:hypothetical protein [Woeseiaceae bacterium]